MTDKPADPFASSAISTEGQDAANFDEDSIVAMLDDFVERAVTRPSRPPSIRPADDPGASAAHRTIATSRRHTGRASLDIDPTTHVRNRISLCNALANDAPSSTRSRLLTTVAELHEHLGEMADAKASLEQAHEADARDVVVLRGLRRHAMRDGKWSEAAALLEREAALPLSAPDHARAFTLLAEIYAKRIGDAAAAERSARKAIQAEPSNASALLLLVEITAARGEHRALSDALAELGRHWRSEPEAEAALLIDAALVVEGLRQYADASRLYDEALTIDESLWPAWLGAARVRRALGDHDGALQALQAASQHTPTEQTRAALLAWHRLWSARLLGDTRTEGDERGFADAVAELALSNHAGSLTERAAALRRLYDDASSIDRGWIAASIAREALRQGELSDAKTWARDAILADANQSFARGVRHLAQARSTESKDGATDLEGDPLQIAAELASQRDAQVQEFQALKLAFDQEESPLVSDVVAADVGATLQFADSVAAALRRQADRSDGTERTATLLALADIADASDQTKRETVLREGKELSPGDPIMCRALSMLLGSNPDVAAALWQEEAVASVGVRAAFASFMALRSAASASDARLADLLAEWPPSNTDLPTLWLLERQRNGTGLAQQASLAHGPDRLLLALLARGFDDPEVNGSTEVADLEAIFCDWFSSEREDTVNLSAALASAGTARDATTAAHLSWSVGDFVDASRLLRTDSNAVKGDSAREFLAERSHLCAGEHTLAAGKAMARIRSAASEADELLGLSQLYWIDRFGRGDMRSARLSLQTIANRCPKSPFIEKALQTHAVLSQDAPRLRDDVALGYTRSASAAEPLQTIDAAWLGIREEPGNTSALRHVLGAAYRARNLEKAAETLNALASLWPPLAAASLQLERARLLERTGQNEAALSALSKARKEHPMGGAEYARALRHNGEWHESAQAFAAAAELAVDPHRAASLWYSAAILYEERLHDSRAALAAYGFAADKDVTYLDLFRRLSELYKQSGNTEALAKLIATRIEAGGDPATIASLHVRSAALAQDEGDLDRATESLQEALGVDPRNLEALRQLVGLHSAKEDWVAAAESLIRIVRLRRDPSELRWAFMKLGEIYEHELGDFDRAEAAYRRVLKLFPRDFETRDRVASLCSRKGDDAEAVGLLDDLIDRAPDEESERNYRIRRATALEALGDERQAEASLESLRLEQPTNAIAIEALADYYQRQRQDAAYTMHLNRAATDLREAIANNPSLEVHWQTLCGTLDARHGPGPASCVANAAVAVGHQASAFAGFVGEQGHALTGGTFTLGPAVLTTVSPPAITDGLRRFFEVCEKGFDKSLPYRESDWSSRKPNKSEAGLRQEASTAGRAFGSKETLLRITNAAPRICVAVRHAPLTILVGEDLHAITTAEERRFLFARAAAVAHARMEPILRAQSRTAQAVLDAALNAAAGRPIADDRASSTKAFLKALPRSARKEIGPLALQILGEPDFGRVAISTAVVDFGNRLALAYTGDAVAGTSALLKLGGIDLHSSLHRARLVVETAEAWRLIQFAISERHFEVRRQAGVDPES